MMNAKKFLRFFFSMFMIAVFLISGISACMLPRSLKWAIVENPDLIKGSSNTQENNLSAGSPQEAPHEFGGEISLFDYTEIIVTPTSMLDLAINNCNIYQDIYGDLLVFGEIKNNSRITKTNMEITFSFFDQNKSSFDNRTISAYAEYLQSGQSMPFSLIYENKEKYIDIAEIKIGINYKNYNKKLDGYPVLIDEDFFYDKDIITIKGNILNMGSNEIENLKLLCTFYNLKNQVVFIRECFLKDDKLATLRKQDFEVQVMIDDYIKDFTHYRIEIFYRDALKA